VCFLPSQQIIFIFLLFFSFFATTNSNFLFFFLFFCGQTDATSGETLYHCGFTMAKTDHPFGI
jgi:hypothetical protein